MFPLSLSRPPSILRLLPHQALNYPKTFISSQSPSSRYLPLPTSGLNNVLTLSSLTASAPIELQTQLGARPKLTPVRFRQPLCVHISHITKDETRPNPAHYLANVSPPTNQLPLSRPHFFPHFSMTDQSVSSHLRTLFELALEDYEIQTKISLAKHPLAQKLENCHSLGSVTTTLLQDQAGTFGEFRGRDRIMKSIRSTVSSLFKLSATATLDDDIRLVRPKTLMLAFHISNIVLQAFPPAKALYTGLGVLLAVCLF